MSSRIDAVIDRISRLDAKIRTSPGQMGLDLTGGGPGTGQPCGDGHIPKAKTCHKGAAAAPKKEDPAKAPAATSATPLTPAEGKARAKGGSKVFRYNSGGNNHSARYFRDRDAAEHWYADDNAQSEADMVAGPYERRRAEWKDAHSKAYRDNRLMLNEYDDEGLLYAVEGYAQAGNTPTRRGVGTDVRIGGNPHSRPIKPGTFDGKAKEAPAPVLANPTREDPGLAPKVKPAGINASDVLSTNQQAKLATQQRQAAQASGNTSGADAWRQEERRANRARLAEAQAGQQQTQGGLFGVEEYDETMPLFGLRRDSADPVAALAGAILREGLPGAQVLDWEAAPRGATIGRAAAEGLVYRFRCDAAGYGYRPAWEGLNEQQWEQRSEGFLMARDPAMRRDFKGTIQKRSGKRKCARGYSCGRSCINLEKECRIVPSSAISKARLRQLETLAKEGSATAATAAKGVQGQRDQKAQELRKGRRTETLERLLKDPRVAEMVRTGKVPEAAADDRPLAGTVRDVRPDQIEVDAARFQYKLNASKSGEVGSLSGVQKWDPNLAGVISVWQDPADNKTYVINGHNRLGLARRLGAENVTVRYLQAKDAKEARAIGAMQNIAEGAGKETDAAKFFRDTGLTTMEQVKAKGLPLNSGKAERGLALAKLPEEMFQAVIQGDLKVRRAAIIGASGLDEDKQREVYKVVKARPAMTDETLQEYVEHLEVSARQTQTELDLLGSRTVSVDDGLHRAELSNGLKKALGREARLLATVSSSRKAVEVLEEKGGNTINVEQSQSQADEARSVLRVFDQLKSAPGPVSTALDMAAARITKGENPRKVQAELRDAVIEALDAELVAMGLRKPEPTNEAPTMSMFDSAIERLAALQARMDGPLATTPAAGRGKKCGNSWIPKAHKCGEGGGATGSKPADKPGQGPVARVASGFQAVARKAGQAIAKAFYEASGKGKRDRKTAQLEEDRRVAAEQRKAREASREAGILAAGPQKWGTKEAEKYVDRDGKQLMHYEARYEVQLEEPIRVKQLEGARLHDKLSFGVAALPAPITTRTMDKLRAAGIELDETAAFNSLEIGWTTGAGGAEASLGHARMDDLPPAVARRLSFEINRKVKTMISEMEEGQIVTCGAFKGDGFGAQRQSLYERAGFEFFDHKGVAVIRNGKLTRLREPRADSRRDSAEINLQQLILQLLTFKPAKGEGKA